jgi:hypothetical protein
LVNPTLAAFTDAEDAKMTSVDVFWRNSTDWSGIVKMEVDAAPTEVEILTVAEPPDPLNNLTQVASPILEAAPAVVGIATSVAIIFVLCIFYNKDFISYLLIYLCSIQFNTASAALLVLGEAQARV